MTSNSSRQSLTWFDLLAGALTAVEVMDISRDFLATLTPQEHASLPAACAPPSRFAAPEEIVLYAFTLVQHRCNTESDDPVLGRMTAFFSQATQRVTKLLSTAEEPSAANAGIT